MLRVDIGSHEQASKGRNHVHACPSAMNQADPKVGYQGKADQPGTGNRHNKTWEKDWQMPIDDDFQDVRAGSRESAQFN